MLLNVKIQIYYYFYYYYYCLLDRNMPDYIQSDFIQQCFTLQQYRKLKLNLVIIVLQSMVIKPQCYIMQALLTFDQQLRLFLMAHLILLNDQALHLFRHL